MKKLIYILTITLAITTVNAQKTYTSLSKLNKTDYLDKTIIIKVQPNFKSVCSNTKINHPLFNSLANLISVNSLQKKFPNDVSPETNTNKAGQAYADLSLIYELTYTSTIDLDKAISKLLLSGILMYAEPHFLPHLCYIPNDPLANPSDQYHLQTINAYNAWNLNKGDSAITIGITDTGTDLTHTDLLGNMRRNYTEIIDNIDNDGDGYIDNFNGWDLGDNDNDPSWFNLAHGIHVSGISSSTPDNNIGGAGVGFYCKFLSVKISNSMGVLNAAYEGIKYAADHGCIAINCSWGGGGSSQFGQDIIDYATINKNCVVIAAAGNNGADSEFFPAAYNYVTSVANTDNADAKNSGSNYGYFIDVCAPGTAINSTWVSSGYGYNTGTSMASPIVAGAAGIVKKQFPSYNGLQIAERLKVTSDDIYSLNGAYTNKLGKGRINLFRAITDPASPSVVFSNKLVVDHNDNLFITGDTLFITGLFTNYLSATAALNVSVTCLSALATSIDNTTIFGVLNTLSSTTNNTDAFRFKLNGPIPVNQAIDFEVLIQDGAYNAKQFFTVYLNVDYINITINDVNTTATSRARIGYNQDGQAQGLGFNYKSTELLYEAGFMMGIDSANVSDCTRGTSGTAADADFFSITKIVNQLPVVKSDFETKSTFNDNTAPSPINTEVVQNTYAWANAPDEQYVIWEYLITNKSTTNTLTNFYTGIFADWDIDGGTYAQNRSAYDATTKMGYCYYTATNGKYAGIKLLTNTAPPNFYAIDNVNGGAGGLDLTNGYSTKEKYLTLSTQRLTAGVSGNGTDNISVMSTGPYTILPNQTITVAFALLGGDSLQHLISGANLAQIKYNGIPTVQKQNALVNDVVIYPNPSAGVFKLICNYNVFTAYEIYSLTGQLITKNKITSSSQNIDLTGNSEGLYFVKLVGENKVVIKKVVVE